MFRIGTTILLLAAFVAQVFTGQLIRLDYMVNTGAYAKNCENKARPKLHCNGKCQMMKKLKEAEKKEQDNAERKYENKEQVLSSKSFYATVTPRIVVQPSHDYYIANEGEAVEMPRSFFHPPSV